MSQGLESVPEGLFALSQAHLPLPFIHLLPLPSSSSSPVRERRHGAHQSPFPLSQQQGEVLKGQSDVPPSLQGHSGEAAGARSLPRSWFLRLGPTGLQHHDVRAASRLPLLPAHAPSLLRAVSDHVRLLQGEGSVPVAPLPDQTWVHCLSLLTCSSVHLCMVHTSPQFTVTGMGSVHLQQWFLPVHMTVGNRGSNAAGGQTGPPTW